MKYIEQKAYNITIEKLIDHCDDLVKSISKNKELLKQWQEEQRFDVRILMSLKKRLMLDQLEFPLQYNHCYFCNLRSLINVYKPFNHDNCSGCEYGLKHGVCSDSDSQYAKLMQALMDVRWEILDYYEG